jgi:multidrug efflux system membrane fusion protein
MHPFADRLPRPASLWLGACLLVLLAACGHEEPAEVAPPVLVVQPGAAGLGVTAYAGEVRAREEPPLGFRIGGKLARRLVDVKVETALMGGIYIASGIKPGLGD